MILCDRNIKERAKQGMIRPFEPRLVSRVDGKAVLSFGLSSYGYDLRLSAKEFKVFRHVPGTVVDPKAFNPHNLEKAKAQCDDHGEFFVLPARSYGLGVAIEQLDLPGDVSAICVGKSTYARCGIIANVTPAEAGWKGHLTLEFSNSSAADCRIYAGEGIVQMIFLLRNPLSRPPRKVPGAGAEDHVAAGLTAEKPSRRRSGLGERTVNPDPIKAKRRRILAG
jgi:dCTP deaminase